MKNLRWMTLALPLMYFSLLSCKHDNDVDVQPPSREENVSLKTMNEMNSQIDTIKLSGHADEDFALVMARHHQGAIDLANFELQEGDDATVKTKAEQILARKTTERDSLNKWLVGRKPTRNATGERFDSLMLATITKYKNLDAVTITGDPDHDFAELMIVHSKTVIEVSQYIVQLGHHDDMKAWARQMVIDENQVKSDLEAWLATNANN